MAVCVVCYANSEWPMSLFSLIHTLKTLTQKHKHTHPHDTPTRSHRISHTWHGLLPSAKLLRQKRGLRSC